MCRMEGLRVEAGGAQAGYRQEGTHQPTKRHPQRKAALSSKQSGAQVGVPPCMGVVASTVNNPSHTSRTAAVVLLNLADCVDTGIVFGIGLVLGLKPALKDFAREGLRHTSKR